MNPIFPPTPYYPIQLPANLKFIDAKGNPVSQLYPVAATPQLDTAQTGAISCNLAATNTLINQVREINLILSQYGTTLVSLQNQINAINTSGAVAIPQVNGFCLNSNTTVPLNVATTLLISNTCQYNTILGTPTALANAILAQCTNLNTLPAFSQNSNMAGLTGWKTSLFTVADAVNNIEISYCDARAGIAKALNAITPTCAQVIVNFQATMPNFYTGINLFFQGYTFIPTGFIDNGSQIVITDGQGGILLQDFNIVTLSNTPGAYNLNTSGSTLSPTALLYTVTVTSNVTNSSIGITCEKVTIVTVPGSSTTSEGGCPDIGNYLASTSGTTFTIITGLSYTPRFVGITAKNSDTMTAIMSLGYYLTYSLGGASITFGNLLGPSTLDIDWIAYR